MMADYDREIEDLKALVTKALEKKGVLSKIRAQLRASVFQAIEEQDKVSEENGEETAIVGGCSKQAKELHNTPSGRLLSGLILEYFEWAELDHTVQIYLPEANLTDSGASRAQLADSLGLGHAAKSNERPLLLELIEARRSQDAPRSSSPTTNSFAPPTSSSRLSAAETMAATSPYGSSPYGPTPSGTGRTRDGAPDTNEHSRPQSPAKRYESPPSPSKVPTAAAFFTSSILASEISPGKPASPAAAFSDPPTSSPREADQRSLLGALPPLHKQALPALGSRRYAGLAPLRASQDEPATAGHGASGQAPSSEETSSPVITSARTRRSSSESEDSPRGSPGRQLDRPATPSEERDISEEIEEEELSVEASDLSVGSQPQAKSNEPLVRK
ncbi:FOP N terminal dimerisation domain containing protein [Klebsormidium nitens]|uniref:FOP N terminal dimerisation domain containing protein n=1 Tax=Klebsormidium nitens TaxID=105231 RepID=A0A1Y1IDM9_KLENI|nr:FOP N terminal dimerisation domain containing protein [Klebsormidium nitens]|eukprot:GAQ88693.1 FOP N terminal dimerisation domain containing protein [Klebsormidium nitens]